MDCADIQRHLSAYLDAVLDAQTRTLVERHLSSCKECRRELESMKALIHDLRNLGSVKAPDDFLDQLHKRMDGRLNVRRFMQRFFIPLRIKIPLQLVTAAAMALLIFAIVYSPHIKKELPYTPVDESLEAIEEPERDISTASIPAEKKDETHVVMSQAPINEEPGLNKKGIQRVEESPPESRSQPFKGKTPPRLKSATHTPQPIKVDDKQGPQVSIPGGVPRVELALLLKRTAWKETGEIPRIQEAETKLGHENKKTGRSMAVDSEKEGSVVLKEEGSLQDRLIKKLHPESESDTWVLSPYEAQKRIEILITDIHGKVLNTVYRKDSGTPELINVEIPGDQYQYFYDRLNSIGTLQDPTPAIDYLDNNTIQILIRLLPE